MAGKLTQRGYTPKWRDDDGNIAIFPAPNTIFDDFADASKWGAANAMFMVAARLCYAGVFEFDHINGKATIPHLESTAGPFGTCLIVEGPHLDRALTDAGREALEAGE